MTIKVLVAAGMLIVTQLVVGYFNGLHIEWILWMGHFPYQADTLPNYRRPCVKIALSSCYRCVTGALPVQGEWEA